MMFTKPTPTLDHHLNMQTSLALHTTWPLLLLFVAQSHALPLCDFFFSPYLFFPCSPSQFVLSHTRTHRHARHAIPHTMRAWLISVSLPCFQKVSGQERPFERHFNPNYVDLKTALDTWGSRRLGSRLGGEWSGSGGLNLTHEYLWVDT